MNIKNFKEIKQKQTNKKKLKTIFDLIKILRSFLTISGLIH